MTLSGSNDFGEEIYTVDIPSDAEYIVFNNGEYLQTVNIPISYYDAKNYYVTGTDEMGHYTVNSYDDSVF